MPKMHQGKIPVLGIWTWLSPINRKCLICSEGNKVNSYNQTSDCFTPASQRRGDESSLEKDFWKWFDNQFTRYVVEDYCQVCLKVVHGIPKVSSLRPKGENESETSAQNRLRNVPRAYKRDLRFKLIDLYVKPSRVPWTQTFALHMLRLVFNTTASATYVNKAFASSSRTSKERIDFRPVLNSITPDALALLRGLYDQASKIIEDELLPQARQAAERKARDIGKTGLGAAKKFRGSIESKLETSGKKKYHDTNCNQFYQNTNCSLFSEDTNCNLFSEDANCNQFSLF